MAWLVKKANGIWYVGFRLEEKERYVSCRTKNKKAALEILHKYENDEFLDTHEIRKKKIAFGDFLKSHLMHAETTLSPQWLKNKTLIFDNFLVPFFGDKTLLKNVTKAKIEDYRAMRLKTVSPRTVNIEVNCLMAMLRHAVDRDDLEPRYLPKIKKLQEIGGRLRYLSREEIPFLREAAHNHSPEMEAYVSLMLFAGLRSGEALALRWVDVDLNQKALYISPRDDWRPKSGKGRVIPIPKDLLEFLGVRRVEIAEAELVVHGERNTPYMLKRRLRDVVVEAGLPIEGEAAVTAHVLRHTYASHLVMKGVPLYTVSALLGHSSVKTTEIYAHLAPGHLADAVKEVGY